MGNVLARGQAISVLRGAFDFWKQPEIFRPEKNIQQPSSVQDALMQAQVSAVSLEGAGGGREAAGRDSRLGRVTFTGTWALRPPANS